MMLDLFKEIWQTMRTSKLRTFLTGFSVAWGIFMLILLLAIANGIINSAQQNMQGNDPNRISLWGGFTTMPYKGLKEGRSIELRSRDFDPILEANPSQIDKVTATVSYNAKISTSKDFLSRSSCVGVFPEMFNGHYKLVSGRFINEADIRDSRKVIMLNEQDVPTLFDAPSDCIGKIVNVGNAGFTVIGVYKFDWGGSEAYIPFSTARALSGFKDDFNRIDVHIKNVSTAEESGAVEQQVREAMGKTEGFDPADEGALWTFDRFASEINNAKGLNILNYTMWVIGILTLITGIVGVSNIMFVSVRERTHEIGVRRAIGAKPRSILVQVVLESVALTTCFGYIGIVMGTIATEIVKKVFAGSQFMMNPEVDIRIAVQVTIALIIAGALAGIFPAMRALKIKPVEALRDE